MFMHIMRICFWRLMLWKRCQETKYPSYQSYAWPSIGQQGQKGKTKYSMFLKASQSQSWRRRYVHGKINNRAENEAMELEEF